MFGGNESFIGELSGLELGALTIRITEIKSPLAIWIDIIFIKKNISQSRTANSFSPSTSIIASVIIAGLIVKKMPGTFHF